MASQSYVLKAGARVSSACTDPREGHALVVFILILLDLVPPFDEVLDDIPHGFACETKVDVMPWHPTDFQYRDLVRHIIIDLLEIHDSTYKASAWANVILKSNGPKTLTIVVILSREQDSREIRRMTVCHRTGWKRSRKRIAGIKKVTH